MPPSVQFYSAVVTGASAVPDLADVLAEGNTATGPILLGSGLVTAPSYSFNGDPDTGMYRNSVNSLDFAAGGNRRMALDTAIRLLSLIACDGQVLRGNLFSVDARTSSSSINTTSNMNGVLTNTGAVGDTQQALPTASAGRVVEFAVGSANYLRIDAAAGDVIRDAGTVSVAAGYIRSNVIGSTLRLIAIDATTWMVMSKQGTWTIDS